MDRWLQNFCSVALDSSYSQNFQCNHVRMDKIDRRICVSKQVRKDNVFAYIKLICSVTTQLSILFKSFCIPKESCNIKHLTQTVPTFSNMSRPFSCDFCVQFITQPLGTQLQIQNELRQRQNLSFDAGKLELLKYVSTFVFIYIYIYVCICTQVPIKSAQRVAVLVIQRRKTRAFQM